MLGMKSEQTSAKIKNYSIAIFFIVISILAVVFGLNVSIWTFEQPEMNAWAECRNDSAHVFIGANQDLLDVRCIALDKEYFAITEVNIGDLTKNSEDVCKFRLVENTTEPLRFEIFYNGKSKKEVCEWQHYPRYID